MAADIRAEQKDRPHRASLSRRDALVAGFGGLCLCCVTSSARAGSFTLDEVAPGLFIRQGTLANATPENLDAICNTGFIVGADGVLVTETGGSLADGQWLRAEIRKRTSKPIRWVVLSHVHPDHTFGAGAFVEDKPEFIGHAMLPAALRARGEFYRKRLADLFGADKTGPVVMPTRTVAGEDHVDIGDRLIRFQAHGPAHTTCDLSMLDSQSGLLLPADLLFVKRIPSIDGSLLGWLKELDALEATKAAKAVPGHGPTTIQLAEAVRPLRAYLTTIRDEVRAEIKAGQDIEHASRTVAQTEREHWALFDDYNGRNVTEAYRELEWE